METHWHPSGIVTFLSDYGEQDSYVAQVKGVILSRARQVIVVDVTHLVPPQDILEGAFQLFTAWRAFPVGTVHLAIVDPGVGSARRAVVVLADGHAFVAPDNGLLALVYAEAKSLAAWELDRPSLFRQPVSATFHGRDIFGPVAAALATGIPPSSLGSPLPVNELVSLSLEPVRTSPQSVSAPILSIDRFGNCRTLIRPEHVPVPHDTVVVRCGRFAAHGIVRTFADVEPGQPLAYFGSHGGLEIAVREGSAATRWQLERGMLVTVEFAAGRTTSSDQR